MHDIDLILTLTGGLSAALILGYITQRVGLSPIAGYLLAGTVLGPHTPGYVANREIAEQLAEVGVILLMFGVGLQFHFEELLAVRRVAITGAVVQSLAATVLTTLLAHAIGSTWDAGIVLGLALSVASTVVLIRVLADNGALHTRAGHTAVGWLVVEDLFTVIILVVMPAIFGPSPHMGLAAALGVTALKVAALVALTAIVGMRLIPWLLDRVAATRSRELFTLAVLVIALGIAVGSAMVFGVSMALGAFLAGLIVGRSEFSLRAASDALPMRDAFAVLFFVSVGMLFEPASLLRSPGTVIGALAVVMIGKPLAAFLVMAVLRVPRTVALPVGVALSQVGEFSFILAALGRDLGVLTPDAMNLIVAVAIVSIVLNPILYKGIRPFEAWRTRRAVAKGTAAATAPDEAAATTEERGRSHRAVIVGYGPSGRTVTRLLRENDVEPSVIELNVETVRALKNDGIHAVYGDASRRETLDAAGLARAGTIVLSAAGLEHGPEIIRLARAINPGIVVLARAAYLRDSAALRAAGADGVFSGEAEVALALTEAVLRRLGATPEQVERERARARAELIG
jgi:monovalent cation:H+ antiporter-2, CPA2 family